MKQEKAEDVAFVYDYKSKKLNPLSVINNPLTPDSTAVLYLTCHPKNISNDIFIYLQNLGFKKVKIEYKDVNSPVYKTINIDNLKNYIYSKPSDKDIYQSIVVVGFLLLLVFIIYKLQN